MANVLDARDRLNSLTLSRLGGESININGVDYDGIYETAEYEDETGIKKIVTVTVSYSDAALFSRGDLVIARGVNYRIDKIQPTDSPMVDIELKHA